MLIGGIYSAEKCAVCGGRMVDDGKSGVRCPVHPQCKSSKIYVKFRTVLRRFGDKYDLAAQFLAGLRFKVSEGTFDDRDYRKDQPLGFENLSAQWLDIREGEVKSGTLSRKHFNNLKNYMSRASSSLGNRNIKTIGFAELEDCLRAQEDLSGKSKSNMVSALHHFWIWLRKRKIITLAQFPEFPEVKYELGYRDTTSKEIQVRILEEVKRISDPVNPKVWIGVRLLCTYPSIRPGELIRMEERHIDAGNCRLIFPHPKEKKFKDVPILRADMDLLQSFPASFPAMPFFRHPKGVSGVREDEAFGEKYFAKWWDKACANLKIEGVTLYPGTKHTTVRALREFYSPEEIKRGGKLATNKAFDRYIGQENDDRIRELYGKSSPDTVLIPILDHLKNSKDAK